MGFDFVVLGATGMQGRIVSRDLLENKYSVLLCGRDKSMISKLLRRYKRCSFKYADLRDVNHVAKIIMMSGTKVVVNCAEGNWNLHALGACMKANVSCVDLGSDIEMTKKQLKLDNELKKRNIISITGCGAVPGIGNVMLRYAARKFDSINTIQVGFSWDSNIKRFVVPFSIQSIMEEFTDPAPIVERKKFVVKYPLDSILEDHHRGIAKQKEFYVRHPETFTFYYYFKDKGLKNIRFYAGFPQHSFEKIVALIDLGFASKEPITINENKIVPIEFLRELLKKIKIPDGYKETENLWVKIFGKKDGMEKRILMECLANTIKGWEDAGCNIDTGMPVSIIAQMIKEGVITEKGSFAPEGIVSPELFFKELRKRKMIVFENGKIIN